MCALDQRDPQRGWAHAPPSLEPSQRGQSASQNTTPGQRGLTLASSLPARAPRVPPKEGKKALDAKQRYLAMGPSRSLRKLARELYPTRNESTTLRTLARWSVDYGWQQLALEHDKAEAERIEWERREALEAENTARQLMNLRLADAAAQVQERLLTHLNALLLEDGQAILAARQSGQPIGRLQVNAQLMTHLYGKMVDIERTARGVPNIITASSVEVSGKDGGPIQIEDARDQLARKIAALAERVGANAVVVESDPTGSGGDSL